MRLTTVILAAASIASADLLTIGTMELSSGEPFCCG